MVPSAEPCAQGLEPLDHWTPWGEMWGLGAGRLRGGEGAAAPDRLQAGFDSVFYFFFRTFLQPGKYLVWCPVTQVRSVLGLSFGWKRPLRLVQKFPKGRESEPEWRALTNHLSISQRQYCIQTFFYAKQSRCGQRDRGCRWLFSPDWFVV